MGIKYFESGSKAWSWYIKNSRKGKQKPRYSVIKKKYYVKW